jgi:intein-encoded DNA endonuclease-like protein
VNPKLLDKETLRTLHWEEGLSLSEIGQKMGFNRNTVARRFYKFGLRTRHGTELRKRKGIQKKPSPLLSYLIGVMFGDGNVCSNSADKKMRVARLKVKDKEFADSFAVTATKIGYRVWQGTSRQYGRVYHVASFHSVDFATWWTTVSQVDRLSLAAIYPYDFIRGLYEAEGSVFLKNGRKRITINMKNESVMCYVDGLLRGLGFVTNLTLVRYEVDAFIVRLEISGNAAVEKFLAQVHPVIKYSPRALGIPSQAEEQSSGVCREQTVPTPPAIVEGKGVLRTSGKPEEIGRNGLSTGFMPGVTD